MEKIKEWSTSIFEKCLPEDLEMEFVLSALGGSQCGIREPIGSFVREYLEQCGLPALDIDDIVFYGNDEDTHLSTRRHGRNGISIFHSPEPGDRLICHDPRLHAGRGLPDEFYGGARSYTDIDMTPDKIYIMPSFIRVHSAKIKRVSIVEYSITFKGTYLP